MKGGRCRCCGAQLEISFVNLGMTPLSNAYLKADQLQAAESFYPLHAFVCETCLLVQLEEFESPESIFSDYAYFSSYSQVWLDHARAYAEMAARRFGLGSESKIVELASNDGYLLQYFVEKGIPVLGVEPAANVAKAAIAKGVPSVVKFFGVDTARELKSQGQAADLIVANNVLAHVPDLNGFVEGIKNLLKPEGVVTVEFPHLLCLMRGNQFDTIYHEHFSYFSFLVIQRLLAHHRLRVFDVECLPTHGGSLRVFGCHADDDREVGERVDELIGAERQAGLDDVKTYSTFAQQVIDIKCEVMDFFATARREQKSVAGYGAPAKGNTLLNYCGIGREFLPYTTDRSPHKQGMFLPGTHIPIAPPEEILRTRPDYVFILPWNLRDEIIKQMSAIREWGGKFVVPIPRVEVL